MAVGIENYPNIVPANADYLNGDIKDTPSGTPVNREVYGDIHQTFRKLLREVNVTPNGLRDNETNGYQYFEAMRQGIKPYDVYTVRLNQTSTNDPVEVVNHRNELSGTIVWTRSGVGTYAGTLVGAFPLNKVMAIQNLSTLGRSHMTIGRFDDDNLLLIVFDYSGVAIDGWTAEVEIRVYR